MQNPSNQPSSQQQASAASHAIATELAGIRHELRELKEQLNKKKFITSNQIAAGILKAFIVLFLLSLLLSIGMAYFISYPRISPLTPNSPQSNPQLPR
ncbi:MAG: hypothetical protein ACREPR_13810 [Brasilonema sp.]